MTTRMGFAQVKIATDVTAVNLATVRATVFHYCALQRLIEVRHTAQSHLRVPLKSVVDQHPASFEAQQTQPTLVRTVTVTIRLLVRCLHLILLISHRWDCDVGSRRTATVGAVHSLLVIPQLVFPLETAFA